MSKLKIIIAGSRDFEDYDYLKSKLDPLLLNKQKEIEIVSGGAKGADSLGERYAKENNLSLKIFPADWKNKGRAAGPLRNIEMADYADECICFWDGNSKGTKHMFETALKKNLKAKLINVTTSEEQTNL